MAFDAARGVTILFGGYVGTYLGDTWTWDGNVWTQVSSSGPTARRGHAMAYDKQRNVVVLFGGRGPESVNGSFYYNDTWEWDGLSWTQKSNTGPSVRRDAAMAFDEARGEMILLGGTAGESTINLNDTWRWDGVAWTQVADGGLPGRFGHQLAYDNAIDRIVLFGGENYQLPVLDDTWTWDGSAWDFRGSGSPPGRLEHGMAFDAARNRMVLFGGATFNNGSLDDTWLWDGTTWTEQAPVVPSSHAYGCGLAYDSTRGVTVLFGGGVGNVGTTFYGTDRIWHWDGLAWRLQASIPYYLGPGARRSLAMTYDAARGNIFADGGSLGASQSNGASTWKYDGSNWFDLGNVGWSVKDHAMTYDSARQRVVMVRKRPAGPQFTETWEYDGTSWALVSTAGPLPRAKHALAFDSSRGVTVLFGGESTQSLGNFEDTWEWDGATWSQRATTGPSPRNWHAMAFDEQLGKTVLFGGNAGDELDDTWTWDGNIWEQLSIAGPPARDQHRMSYDSDRGRIVMFGGKPFEADTWEFAAECPVSNSRFLSIPRGGLGDVSAVRVTLQSLHHVVPPYTGGASIPFTAFEGQVRWVGPATANVESTGSGVPIYTATLQCTPHYQDWGGGGNLHITGSAIVPSSDYLVERLDQRCAGSEDSCATNPVLFKTTRWADVEEPFNPTNAIVQPDVTDISALVNKFKSAPDAPSKARTLLVGDDAFGNFFASTLSQDLGFGHIAACVDAYRGKPYPHTIEACP